MVWIFVTLKFKSWNLNPQFDGISRWVFGRLLGHEDGAVTDGIDALM